MAHKMTTEQFIKKAQHIHGSRYVYSSEYKGSHEPIVITCPVHGDFYQRPYCHTLLKQGCPKCGVELSHSAARTTQTDFIAKARTVHSGVYDYSRVQYINNRTKITVICPTHGEFSLTPNSHLRGIGCRACGYASNAVGTEEFIRQAVIQHGNRYIYSNVVYHRSDKKVHIVCPVHGTFHQNPRSHLNGSGCPHCAKANKQGGFSEEYFLENPQRRYVKGLLYIVQLHNETEDFIKVGITTQTVQRRFSGHSAVYAYDLVYEQPMTIYDAFTTEQRLLVTFADSRYIPNFSFAGWTECFVADPAIIVSAI